MTVEIRKNITGSILDIGGGGECIIGRIFGAQVTAIDSSREELDEAPDCCEKLLMDAAALSFPDESFDNITFFYSLMFMNSETQEKAIAEAVRVLKPGGELYIWDCDIDSAYPDPFIVDLDVVSDLLSVHTAYGIIKDGKQDSDMVLRYLAGAGVDTVHTGKNEGQFYIRCRKPQKEDTPA